MRSEVGGQPPVDPQMAQIEGGAHASPRVVSGVLPETLLGETPNSTRETRMLPSV
ncbi:MAG TPA: hypothetical protein VIS96_08890 [Terrimicrobiaceae bacterium]